MMKGEILLMMMAYEKGDEDYAKKNHGVKKVFQVANFITGNMAKI